MQSNEILDFLNKELERKLLTIVTQYPEEMTKVKVDYLGWLGRQQNILAITTPKAIGQLSHYLQDESNADVGMGYIIDVTIRLKFFLGAEEWETLLDTLSGALRLSDKRETNEEEPHNAFTDVNKELMKIRPAVLRNNHWLVPIILYAMDSRTRLTVEDFKIKLETMVRQHRGK